MTARKAEKEIEITEIPYPVKAGEMFGNSSALESLGAMLGNGTLNPTLLVSGPPSVGKTTLAYIIAAALECESPSPFACGQCLACRKIKRGIFPDLKLITLQEAESGKLRSQILVDQIRDEVLKPAELPPYEGRKLVFIVEPAEALNISSQNALLKALEEPPSYVHFILVAKEPSKLLPTVRSRCQELRLRELTASEMAAVASKAGLGREAGVAAETSRGRPGLLLSGEWKDYLEMKKAITGLLLRGPRLGCYPETAALIDDLLDYRETVVLDETAYVIKELLRMKHGVKEAPAGISGDLASTEGADLYSKAGKVVEAMELLNRNVNVKFIYENLFLEKR